MHTSFGVRGYDGLRPLLIHVNYNACKFDKTFCIANYESKSKTCFPVITKFDIFFVQNDFCYQISECTFYSRPGASPE